MKHLISIIGLCAGIALNAGAQTFTQRIQQQKAGQGTVTIHESTEIDQLVNSATLGGPTSRQSAKTSDNAGTSQTTTNSLANTTGNTRNASTSDSPADNTVETPVDNTKKMMHGYKVTGYRVQAFAGGNSRKDRQQAEYVGNQIKSSFPEVPVYVHFYSPRWICRVGNYRTYEEAHQMLISLRKLGFTQATIVKGKITVQD